MSAGVSLTEVPEAGTDLEDFVAALFHASGFFVEKNLIERDPTDILELDVIATDYTDLLPRSMLCEAKGGQWGWPDLFKLVGWMKYLDFGRGAFFVKEDAGKDLERVALKLASLNISLVHFGDFSDAVDRFQASGLGIVTPQVVSLWRHSNAIERKLISFVQKAAKSEPEKKAASEILAYHRLVNDGIFHAENTISRLHQLYEAFKQHPHITLACAIEQGGGDFDPNAPPTESPLIREAMQEGEHPLLQAAMYVEHRARLAILKAAVDYTCEMPGGTPPMVQGNSINWELMLYYSLPESVRDGMDWLREQPTFRRYALFWQQFLWGWGGFFLSDRTDTEFAWMSAYSGIPVAEVPTALQAYDQFFPTGGWFVQPGPTKARRVKMLPMYFEGLGAHHRRVAYGLANFSGLNTADYTSSDLARWNNCAVAFLLS